MSRVRGRCRTFNAETGRHFTLLPCNARAANFTVTPFNCRRKELCRSWPVGSAGGVYRATTVMLRRRDFLTTTAWLIVTGATAHARVISGALPWSPNAGDPPMPARLGPWMFFTAPEAACVEALADRIIPPDPKTPGGKDAGCAVYLDRQMAGAYGHGEGLYTRPPFMKGSKQQGSQTQGGVSKTYRDGLAALDKYCRAKYSGKAFPRLSDADKERTAPRPPKGRK